MYCIVSEHGTHEFINRRRNFAKRFEDIFQRFLSGDELDVDTADVSSMFDVVAANLLAEIQDRKPMYYDGVSGLTAHIRKPRQVEFKGEMWVGKNSDQWTEDFRAVVTDKRVTKQGIWLTIWIGSDRAEGELLTAFGLGE